MKTLFLFLLLPLLALGQFQINTDDSFNIGIIIDPYASFKESGLCVGIELEYMGPIYARAGVTTFPRLTDGYTDIIGAFGPVFTFGDNSPINIYTGIRLGVIIREEANGSGGFEGGVNYNITENFLLGLRGTYDYRSDWKFYGADTGWQYSTFVKAAYCW